MPEFLGFVSYLLTLYTYVVFAVVIMSFLLAFNVVNARNDFVRSLWQALNAVTEPVLRPIRAAMPDLGAIDISPLVLLLIIQFIQVVVFPNPLKAL